jgi:acetoin utilization protein AcuB
MPAVIQEDAMDHRCPQCGAALPQGVPASVRQVTVGRVMTRDPRTVGPEDNLLIALEALRRHHVRRLPVVVGDELVGIVAEGDLKRASPSTLSDSQEEYLRVMEQTPVSRIMVAQVLTTTEDALLIEAVRTLLDTKYGALPVLRAGKLVGIVTDSDLLRFLADAMTEAG